MPPLDPSRLKLHGRGAWDPYEYLPDSLALPFLSPDCLLHGACCSSECAPDVSREKVSAVADLAKLWDSLGLLWLEAKGRPKGDELSYVRIFNAVKNATTDRQIGDRRGRNFTEFPVHAASAGLPTGPMLLALHADPAKESLAISVTDRRDYYHQFSCSRARARTNMLFPPVPASLLKGTKAYQELLDRAGLQESVPQPLGVRKTVVQAPPAEAYVCFKSVLQGDHLGVELATAAHRSFLKASGCLLEGSELRADEPFPTSKWVSGLVIDDFFSVSVQAPGSPEDSQAAVIHDRALAAYAKAQLDGSPGKDVRAMPLGKVAGCELDASDGTRGWGRILAGAPREKRLCIASITLAIAALPRSTDSLHLSVLGAWTWIIMYGRPLMAIFKRAFSLVKGADCVPQAPRYIDLPRPVADELVLACVLSPMMCSDLGAPWL